MFSQSFLESDVESTASSPRGGRPSSSHTPPQCDNASNSPLLVLYTVLPSCTHLHFILFVQCSRFKSLFLRPSLSQKPKLSRHLRVEAVPMGPPAPPPQSSGPSRSIRAPDPFIEELHAVDKELELSPLCIEPYQVPNHIHTQKKYLCLVYMVFSLKSICMSVCQRL